MKFLSGKNILIISPEAWGKIFLSKHCYAIALADTGNKVWFLNPPHTDLDATEFRTESGNAIRLIKDRTIRGLRFFPIRFQRFLMHKQVARLEDIAGANFDLVLSFDNSRYYFLDLFSGAFSIHFLADLEVDYHLNEACSSATLCLGVSRTIVKKMSGYNTNSHFIQHGFMPVHPADCKLPDGQGRARALYIGNLLMHYFDIDLMAQLADQNPDVDFYLIGSTGKDNLNRDADKGRLKDLDNLIARANVYPLGPKNINEIQALAQQADVHLLMYFNYYREPDNSSKILYYLATGKVIVSNFFREYEGSDLLLMAHNRLDFIKLFRDTVNRIGYWNKPELALIRKSYADANNYQNKLMEIDNLISNSR